MVAPHYPPRQDGRVARRHALVYRDVNPPGIAPLRPCDERSESHEVDVHELELRSGDSDVDI